MSPLGYQVGRWITQSSTRRDLWLLFALAIVLRVIIHLLSVSQIGFEGLLKTSPDTINYVGIAKDFIEGTTNYKRFIFGFGPGYSSFLALNFTIFGLRGTPVIIVQILLSGIGCLMIYRLGIVLTHSYATAFIAALIAATSYTSITLSCLLLSDSFFYFLFLLALILYLRGLSNGSWSSYIISGALVGMAILTRSVAQFWPVAMVVIAIVFTRTKKQRGGKKSGGSFKDRIVKPSVAVVIAVSIVSLWMIRNYSIHGVPTVAFTNAFGPATIAAQTLTVRRDPSYRDLLKKWTQDYLEQENKQNLTSGERFNLFLSKAREVFREKPWPMIRTYLLECWTNLNDICYYHRYLIPHFNPKTIPLEKKFKNLKLNYLNFVLSMVGLIVLLITRQYQAFWVLACIYFYFFGMIGSFPWQGSRLFMPGQIAEAILIAVVLVTIGLSLKVFWYRLKKLLKLPKARY